MVKVLIGDIFASKAHALVNTVNCVGVMGKGIALDFKKRFPDMFKRLSQLDLDVEIFAPYGTPPHELTAAFLSAAGDTSGVSDVKGVIQGKVKQGWVALLEVLWLLEKQPYAAPVGRVTFQKICYTLTELGIETGFHFKQGAYGPYAPEVKEALAVFANANLAREQQMGSMIAMKTGDQYEPYRQGHRDYLKTVEKKIDKTVDLFCRIKNTEQAEEVATVFFAVRELKKEKTSIAEQDVFDYILKWKKTWNSPEKKRPLPKRSATCWSCAGSGPSSARGCWRKSRSDALALPNRLLVLRPMQHTKGYKTLCYIIQQNMQLLSPPPPEAEEPPRPRIGFSVRERCAAYRTKKVSRRGPRETRRG